MIADLKPYPDWQVLYGSFHFHSRLKDTNNHYLFPRKYKRPGHPSPDSRAFLKDPGGLELICLLLLASITIPLNKPTSTAPYAFP